MCAAAMAAACALAGCDQPRDEAGLFGATVGGEPVVVLAQAFNRGPCSVDPYDPFPIFVGKNRILVPMEVNGVPTAGVLDTGAVQTLVTPELARAAHIAPGTDKLRLSGASGSFNATEAVVERLAFGSVLGKKMQVGIFPFDGGDGTKVGVQLGLDELRGFDWDADFLHSRMRPYAVQGCAHIEPPWRTAYSGVRLLPDFGTTAYGHAWFTSLLAIPVQFPARAYRAMLDTGSSQTVMSLSAARHAEDTPLDLSADKNVEVHSISGGAVPLREHHFSAVAIGEDALPDFKALVLPHFDRRDSDLILGLDYLRQHHVWISTSTAAFFIDSGTMPAPQPPTDHPRIVGGAARPELTEQEGKGGVIHASCLVRASGVLDQCRVLSDAGYAALDKPVMEWLTGGFPPVVQPAYRDGKAIDQLWMVDVTIPVRGAKPAA